MRVFREKRYPGFWTFDPDKTKYPQGDFMMPHWEHPVPSICTIEQLLARDDVHEDIDPDYHVDVGL